MSKSPPFIARRATRVDVCIHAQVRVHPQDGEVLKLSTGVTSAGPWLDVDVVDLSLGGLGYATSLFLPRGVRVMFRLMGSKGEPSPVIGARVQRVVMTDRRPSYIVGCAFDETSDEAMASIRRILSEFLSEGSVDGQ